MFLGLSIDGNICLENESKMHEWQFWLLERKFFQTEYTRYTVAFQSQWVNYIVKSDEYTHIEV